MLYETSVGKKKIYIYMYWSNMEKKCENIV